MPAPRGRSRPGLRGFWPGQAAGAEIAMDLPEEVAWIALRDQTIGPSIGRTWVPAGSGPEDSEWLVVEQRFVLDEPRTVSDAVAVLRDLARTACTAVEFDSPEAVDTAVGEGVVARAHCAQMAGRPYGVVTDQWIVVDGAMLFVVSSDVRTPASPEAGTFGFGSVVSGALGERLSRSRDFVRKSVRLEGPAAGDARGMDLKAPATRPRPVAPFCLAAAEVKGNHTAAGLAFAARACSDADDYDGMAELLMVGNALAYYDALRVTDPSAHGALNVVMANQFGGVSEQEGAAFVAALEQLAADEDRVRAVCLTLAALGPPAYRPTYMLVHGLGEIAGVQEEPPLREIDAAAGWEEALAYVRCSGG